MLNTPLARLGPGLRFFHSLGRSFVCPTRPSGSLAGRQPFLYPVFVFVCNRCLTAIRLSSVGAFCWAAKLAKLDALLYSFGGSAPNPAGTFKKCPRLQKFLLQNNTKCPTHPQPQPSGFSPFGLPQRPLCVCPYLKSLLYF